MMQKLDINIFNTDLEWMGMIDEIESFVHVTSWNDTPNSELRVSKRAKSINELQLGRILVVNDSLDKALVIDEMQATLDDAFWIFTLSPLKGILNYRVCHPKDAKTYTNQRQSFVMMDIVNKNLFTQTRDSSRYFQDAAKTRNMLKIASMKYFGDYVDFTVEYDTGFMGETMTTLSNMFGTAANYPLGWNIYITPDFLNYEMDVYYGTHRTVNQSIVPPVVFSEEYNNIENATYTLSVKDWRNFTYIIYEDEAGAKWETHVINLKHGAAESFNRREMLIESNVNATPEAKSEGDAELNKLPKVESFTADIVNNNNTMSTYNKDWFLGDIVTIQSKDVLTGKLISVDAQITEIEEIYDAGQYSMSVTFGYPKLSVFHLIKNAIR